MWNIPILVYNNDCRTLHKFVLLLADENSSGQNLQWRSRCKKMIAGIPLSWVGDVPQTGVREMVHMAWVVGQEYEMSI